VAHRYSPIRFTPARAAIGLLALSAATGAAWFALRGETPGRERGPRAGAAGAQTSGLVQGRAQGSDSARAREADGSRSAAQEVVAAASAESIVHLADTSGDPRVIEAALREVLSTYSSRSSQKRAPDAELDRVLIRHVHASQPSVAAAALEAARLPLMTEQPSEALTSSIVELAKPERDPARRQAALVALNLIRPDRRAPHVLASFEQALAAREPQIVSAGLLALSQSGSSLLVMPEPTRARVAARVLELAAALDPGVRGRSLAVFAELDWLASLAARYELGARRLRDAHPYVRAQAADLLLRCREPAAIHALIALVGDLAEARYELTGFAELDGSPGTLVHVVPGRRRVAEAALLSIVPLSQSVPRLTPLFLTLGGRVRDEASVLQNAEVARSWYRAEAARIPRTVSTHDR
jgi:hypothetical protein